MQSLDSTYTCSITMHTVCMCWGLGGDAVEVFTMHTVCMCWGLGGDAVEVFTVVAGTGQTTMWPDPLHMQLIRNVMSDHTFQRLLSGVTFCSVHGIICVRAHVCEQGVK